jgi:hypothetical protein
MGKEGAMNINFVFMKYAPGFGCLLFQITNSQKGFKIIFFTLKPTY